MRVDLFDFELPDDLIALRPAEPRDSARLLVVEPDKAGPYTDDIVCNLADHLRPGDCLVCNDTRVIHARLRGTRQRAGGEGAVVEATLHQRLTNSRWSAFARPAKRLRPGDVIRFGAAADRACLSGALCADVLRRGEGGLVELEFELSGAVLDEAIAAHGEMPLPPYIAGRRATDERDRDDYQTMFAAAEGAVAAPTAGLHFTPQLLQRLQAAGIGVQTLTLHVGAGTFLPVKAEDTSGHTMHSEWGELTSEAAQRLQQVRKDGGRVIAVGTTSMRLLESAARADHGDGGFRGPTDIFITPGHRFLAVDGLITNFHLPRSTLFMLVSAFSGLDTMKAAYAHAIARGYRFYSYGDASLLWPQAR